MVRLVVLFSYAGFDGRFTYKLETWSNAARHITIVLLQAGLDVITSAVVHSLASAPAEEYNSALIFIFIF